MSETCERCGGAGETVIVYRDGFRSHYHPECLPADRELLSGDMIPERGADGRWHMMLYCDNGEILRSRSSFLTEKECTEAALKAAVKLGMTIERRMVSIN
jgi:hypothetical protein